MKSELKPDVCVVGLGYIGLPTAAIIGGGEGRLPSMAIENRVQVDAANHGGIQGVTKRLTGEDGIGIGHKSERRWRVPAWKGGQRKVSVLATPGQEKEIGRE